MQSRVVTGVQLVVHVVCPVIGAVRSIRQTPCAIPFFWPLSPPRLALLGFQDCQTCVPQGAEATLLALHSFLLASQRPGRLSENSRCVSHQRTAGTCGMAVGKRKLNGRRYRVGRVKTRYPVQPRVCVGVKLELHVVCPVVGTLPCCLCR